MSVVSTHKSDLSLYVILNQQFSTKSNVRLDCFLLPTPLTEHRTDQISEHCVAPVTSHEDS